MDLIDRQAAIKVMTSVLWHLPNERYRNLNEYEFSKGLAELGLNSVPSVQPEIIYCKDCKHYNVGFECLIEGYGIERNKNWYCADAERRTDG